MLHVYLFGYFFGCIWNTDDGSGWEVGGLKKPGPAAWH